MAFRHYQGAVPNTSGMWKCPSCGAENLGALSAGCMACKVGADGQHVGVPEPKPTPLPGAPTTMFQNGGVTILQPSAQDEGFRAWALGQPAMIADEWDSLQAAFDAGVAWARTQQRTPADPRDPQVQRPAEATTPMTGATLYMATLDTALQTHMEPVEDRILQTILAALIFYRDNTLGYGAIPGQLSAQEVTELVGKLQPVETDPDIPF